MMYSFNCFGHENITAKHKTTLEFTKDKDVSLKGDCIVGARADFSLPLLKNFIREKIENQQNNYKDKKTNPINKIPIKIIIRINDIKEEVNGFLNPDFNDANEIVIRKSNFFSGRTLAVGADKGASELRKGIREAMKKSESKIKVIFE